MQVKSFYNIKLVVSTDLKLTFLKSYRKSIKYKLTVIDSSRRKAWCIKEFSLSFLFFTNVGFIPKILQLIVWHIVL